MTTGRILRQELDKARIGPDEFSAFALEEAEDNRLLRSSLSAAIAIHLLLVLINFPAFESESRAAAERTERIFVLDQPRWQPPEVPKTTIPPQLIKRTPVPDLTPHDPEPIRLDEPRAEFDLPEVDADYFVIPAAPPALPEPEGPIPVRGEVTKPVKIHAPQPTYTEIARRTHIQGTVIVQAIIDQQGDVTRVQVLKELPMGLTEAAVNAIKLWKFKPATLRGKPVEVFYNLTVTFHLLGHG